MWLVVDMRGCNNALLSPKGKQARIQITKHPATPQNTNDPVLHAPETTMCPTKGKTSKITEKQQPYETYRRTRDSNPIGPAKGHQPHELR